jgi:Fe-S oxidoreductase
MPNDEDVRRLCKQSFHLAEFLHAEQYEPPRLEGRAIVHGHCHEKATSGFEPLTGLLEKMGLELETPDSGCCGMAGAWGYEKGHYDVSIACGERVLFPQVRASADALIVTDGFSCKTQVEQGTGRRALHLAEVLQLAHNGRTPEKPEPSRTRTATRAGAVAAAALAGGALALRGR